MNNCITKVPLGTIYLYQGLDQNCKPVWNYADNGSGNSAPESGTPLRKGDSVLGADKLTHIIDDGFISSILDIIDTASLDLTLTGNDLKGDVNPLWVKSLLTVNPSTYINLTYNSTTGVISASLNTTLLFEDYFANLQIGAFAYGATFLVGVDGKKYTIPAQTVSYEASSKRLYISNGNFAILPLTALELSSELSNLPTTTDAVYGTTLVLGNDGAWHKLPVVSGGGGTDSQQLSIAGNVLSLTNGGSVTLPSGGTDSQQLSIAGNVISLTNGGSVTLPASSGTDSQQLSIAGNVISLTNGGSVTLPSSSATTNDISSAVNTLTSNVNGVSDTASIINSNQISVSQASVVSTVNGVASTQAIGAGVAARIAAFDSSGALIHAAVPSGGGGSGANTNDLSSAANIMTSNVDGHVDTAPIINTNQIDISPSFITSNVNGIISTKPILTGTPTAILGFNSSNVPITVTPASLGGGGGVTTNDISSAGNILTSTVNGVSDTSTIITGNQIDISPSFITSNVNGMISARPILTGTPVKILGFDSSNIPITVSPASLGGGTDSQQLSISGNTLSLTNGGSVTLPSAGATTNSLSMTSGGITSTVNGVASTISTPTAGINEFLGFNFSGNPVKSTLGNTLTSNNNRITSTVNGTAANLDANIGTVQYVAGWNSSGAFTSQLASALGGGGSSYTFNDTNSIDLVTSGTTITGNVKKSAASNNSIIENADGLYSPSTLSDLGNPSVIPQGVAAVMGVTDVLGKDLKWRTLPTVSGGGTDSQQLSISGNTLSISNGNSVTLPSSGATTNALTSSNFRIHSNVNGVTASYLPPAGTLFKSVGFDTNGDLIMASPNSFNNLTFIQGGPPNGASHLYAQLDLGVGTYTPGGVLPGSLGGLITVNNPYGVGVDMDFIIFPEQICSLAGFDTLPAGVNSAVASCSIDFFDPSSGLWVEYAANVVNTTVRVSPPPPAGYSATTHAHDNWKSPYKLSIAGGAFGPTQINYRTRLQVYSGVLASVYIWNPVFTVIGLIA